MQRKSSKDSKGKRQPDRQKKGSVTYGRKMENADKSLDSIGEGRNREGEQTSRILREAGAKVAKLTDGDDIEAYLTVFASK